MVTPFAHGHLLRLAETAPALRPEAIAGPEGGLLVVAPHPGDESLATGRLIAALRAADRPVAVVLLTDGAASQRSPRLSRDALARLRARELREALRHLGGGRVLALGHPDHGAPERPNDEELARVAALVDAQRLRRAVTCWRGDPHPDHRAGALWTETLCRALGLPMAAEAAVWGRFTETGPDPGRRLVRLSAPEHAAAKARAIASHRSRMTPLIPDGSVMDAETQAHFRDADELYLLAGGA